MTLSIAQPLNQGDLQNLKNENIQQSYRNVKNKILFFRILFSNKSVENKLKRAKQLRQFWNFGTGLETEKRHNKIVRYPLFKHT